MCEANAMETMSMTKADLKGANKDSSAKCVGGGGGTLWVVLQKRV